VLRGPLADRKKRCRADVQSKPSHFNPATAQLVDQVGTEVETGRRRRHGSGFGGKYRLVSLFV
jgi:hypothetical protein